ncbi:hypothetical protein P4H83_08615 [Paenibacillus favisporus]|nr:hypothetical protein [Paenibacillus favisporus]MEC0174936.1 hypothetical protein [Paenibacillus favisporus]
MRKFPLTMASMLLFGFLLACNQSDNLPDNALSTEISKTDDNPGEGMQQPSTSSPGTSAERVSRFPESFLSGSVVLDSVSDTRVIRAETVTRQGSLLMISQGREERGHLAVPSNYGREGDLTFQADYSIVYRQAGKEDAQLLDLPAFLFVRPTDEKVPFEQVRFQDADVYFLAPQYKSGHGMEAYVFAIDRRSGEATALKVMQKGHAFGTLVYSEVEPFPHIENDRLVVHPAIGAGTPEEDTLDVLYRLDLANKRLVAIDNKN